MSAWQVRRPGPMDTGPLERVTTRVPRPAPSELLVAVHACGVCRTDLHVTEGDLPVHRERVIPGHEVVGEVIEVGSAVGAAAGGEFDRGDRVGIAWLRHTCGVCKYCRRGSENLCPQSRYTGWDATGDTPNSRRFLRLSRTICRAAIATASWRRCCAPASSDIDRCCAPSYHPVAGWVSTDSAAVPTSPPRSRWRKAPKYM